MTEKRMTLVTGVSSGIGQATATAKTQGSRLRKRGSRVASASAMTPIRAPSFKRKALPSTCS